MFSCVNNFDEVCTSIVDKCRRFKTFVHRKTFSCPLLSICCTLRQRQYDSLPFSVSFPSHLPSIGLQRLVLRNSNNCPHDENSSAELNEQSIRGTHHKLDLCKESSLHSKVPSSASSSFSG